MKEYHSFEFKLNDVSDNGQFQGYAARERHSLMKLAAQVGGRSGLSIGFQTVRDEPDAEDFNIRRLKEVRLMEYSLVTFPMNPEAGVTRIKTRRTAGGNFKPSDCAQRTSFAGSVEPAENLYESLHTLLTHLRAS